MTVGCIHTSAKAQNTLRQSVDSLFIKKYNDLCAPLLYKACWNRLSSFREG